jgi:hypothetical protein
MPLIRQIGEAEIFFRLGVDRSFPQYRSNGGY